MYDEDAGRLVAELMARQQRLLLAIDSGRLDAPATVRAFLAGRLSAFSLVHGLCDPAGTKTPDLVFSRSRS